MKLTTVFHLLLRLRVSRALPLLFMYVFMLWTKKTLPLLTRVFCDDHRRKCYSTHTTPPPSPQETQVFHTWITVPFAPNRCQPFQWFLLIHTSFVVYPVHNGLLAEDTERGCWQGNC
jgi:hypothetical protein